MTDFAFARLSRLCVSCVIDHIVSRPRATRLRIRFGNLTMTNHPIHMHGYGAKCLTLPTRCGARINVARSHCWIVR